LVYEPKGDIEQAVAAGDPDRMAAAFFAPARVRADLMALYAFNLELARVRDLVTEPMAGQLRFAWWRDQINRIGEGKPLDAPVGRAFAEACRRHNLPLDMVQGLIDARSQELTETPFATDAEFDAHALATSSAIMMLAARICGAGDKADAVAKPSGIAFALVGVLRSLAHDARRRRSFIPLGLLAKEKLGPEQVFTGDMDRIRPAVQAMAVRARQHIWLARRFPIPSKALAAILPTVLARQYIPLLLKPDVDLYAAALQIRRLTAIASLGRAAMTGRV
jgi:phytoene synthase